MYRVVLIDDEPFIVESMAKGVDWKKWDCEVVAMAYDGEEGQKIIREFRPDIIFTDIAMPGEDGLTMIAALKSEFEDMEISILTGYRNFDFAQKAVYLGVTRFLLKPSDLEELEEALDKMIYNLKRKQIFPDKKAIDGKEGETTETGAAGNFIVKKAIEYIEKNYDQKLTLAKVAEQVCVSQWHLSKLLHKHLDQNFTEILNNVRIQKAKELLEESSLKIGDIAKMIGFVDATHFAKIFKNMEGMSPHEYRNKKL